MDIGRGAADPVEQQRGRRLDEAETALGHFAWLDAKIGEIVHGEAKSPLGQRRQALVLDRPHGADRALGELEHQRRRDRAVGLDEFEQLREDRLGQRRRGEIAEHADFSALERQAADDLDASQHHQVVELRHQRAGFRVGEEISGGYEFAVAELSRDIAS